MKHFNNMLLGLMTAGTVAICFSASTVKCYAQAEESVDSSEVFIISAIPETGDGGEGTFHGPHTPWPEKLGLTDDQMEQLVSLKSAYMVETAKQKAELKADMSKLCMLMTGPNLDKQAVLSLNEKMDQLKTSLSNARVNHMLSVMSVMTPKQREEMHHHMLVHKLSHRHSWGKAHKKGEYPHSA